MRIACEEKESCDVVCQRLLRDVSFVYTHCFGPMFDTLWGLEAILPFAVLLPLRLCAFPAGETGWIDGFFL